MKYSCIVKCGYRLVNQGANGYTQQLEDRLNHFTLRAKRRRSWPVLFEARGRCTTASPRSALAMNVSVWCNIRVSNPGYPYRFAQIVTNKNSNVIIAGVIRPGDTDPTGRTSDGVKGDTVGDNYDGKRVNQLAQAIEELKQINSPSTAILAGHSGGAAITANITFNWGSQLIIL